MNCWPSETQMYDLPVFLHPIYGVGTTLRMEVYYNSNMRLDKVHFASVSFFFFQTGSINKSPYRLFRP